MTCCSHFSFSLLHSIFFFLQKALNLKMQSFWSQVHLQLSFFIFLFYTSLCFHISFEHKLKHFSDCLLFYALMLLFHYNFGKYATIIFYTTVKSDQPCYSINSYLCILFRSLLLIHMIETYNGVQKSETKGFLKMQQKHYGISYYIRNM